MDSDSDSDSDFNISEINDIEDVTEVALTPKLVNIIPGTVYDK